MRKVVALRPTLVVRFVHENPYFSEVEARVTAGPWSALTSANTDLLALLNGARGLLAWAARPEGTFDFDTGDPIFGHFALRWSPANRPGQLACRITIDSGDDGTRDSGRHLSLKLRTDPALVERFCRQLIAVAETRVGEAVLTASEGC